ncbi:uncharacterized protein LOC131317576 [Rhododendron vialii]|uniref:uncharacterized protein LOC131317576 n=1 Tax=Rhododendron vialii TaxID=182163 RepID=UPI00265E6A00|nr:uncharacterized protein LOC131317576 [Rhododendron vialii]
MADWIATVALGKLSNVQGDRQKSNVLWTLWAPLLLLHLGGPDTITAYSLEDNQLWLRHLMGLVVQLSAAIYVILMSWKNSWFSFMSLPALVAGVIKYGERTLVLKRVSDEKYLHRRPYGSLSDKYPTEGHDYVRVLVMAYEHLDRFMWYLDQGGGTLGAIDDRWANHWDSMEAIILWDALGVQMGLVYDLLYTKAAVIYRKKGFLMRCISFGCTVNVFLGLTIQIVLLKTREEEDDDWHEIDIAITGVLTVGALALEIYAAIVIFSSNWMMLWLIKQGRGEWVTWLSQRFPCLFNKKKNWSEIMIGQFDVLSYCLKVFQSPFRSLPPKRKSPIRKIIGSVLGHNYEEKWNRYLHKTEYAVHPSLYNAILQLRHNDEPQIDPRLISDSLTSELREIWTIAEHDARGNFVRQITSLHLATQICYRLEMEWDAGGEDGPYGSDSLLWKQNSEVSKALSDYMMYLIMMHPSLLPNVGSVRALERTLFDQLILAGNAADDVNATCRNLLRLNDVWSLIVERLKGNEKAKRWEIIKLMWLRMLKSATRGLKGFARSNCHFQQLRQGGELLTLIWFINPPYIKPTPP